MRNLIRLAVGGVLTLLAGCGSSNFDRVSTGAGTGAATGATIGLLGGPIGVAAGALIGAGAGAVVGGSTSQQDINLGKPVWRN
ncbi:MAG: hypothetical protein KGJ41_02610 [Rhodospirillales bacterium]|nr:hypothetical protein [Rhodospirillales bacterium]MDE2197888.1 hypothetical protein [Rhodospirillales bacterium]MDE2575524.1 hypothetical protein [Rhodospirillales bacterium]